MSFDQSSRLLPDLLRELHLELERVGKAGSEDHRLARALEERIGAGQSPESLAIEDNKMALELLCRHGKV